MDLMRHVDDAPSGLMDHLFAQVMLWGRANGYATFNLGMAPLAGVESRRLSPLWNRLGAAVYRHGELFYNFQGLRAFKQKFNPLWGTALPRSAPRNRDPADPPQHRRADLRRRRRDLAPLAAC